MNKELQISLYSDYIGRIFHQVHLNIDEMLLPYGITHQQARLIRYIYECEQRQEKICQKQLENKMGLRGSSVTKLLQALEKKKYISRQFVEEDARKKYIYLTENGRKLNIKISSVLKKAEKELLEVVSEEEKTILIDILKRISSNLESNEKERMKR